MAQSQKNQYLNSCSILLQVENIFFIQKQKSLKLSFEKIINKIKIMIRFIFMILFCLYIDIIYLQSTCFIFMSLDQQTAERRCELIRNGSVHYNFQIILEPQQYYGLAEIAFYLQTYNLEQDLEIDFTGTQIVEDIIINNISVEAKWVKNFVYLPKKYLVKGKNKLSIMYRNLYNLDMSGMITFKDGNDQFLYTDFEPYSANRVFPCFDQPSLKATMKLTVIAPSEWKVLSNENPTSTLKFNRNVYRQNILFEKQTNNLQSNFIQKVKGTQNNATIFPATQLLPTYILCFAAGKFVQTKDPKSTLPMSLYCIPSVAENFSKYTEYIFTVTRECMKFFETKFKVKYPFSKYDQVFIKDCSFGAMENAGIVTFNQPRVIPRQNATQYDYYRIALIVSHELSHHWFGNYVTMTWWDDLWLNESFAQWISCYSLEQLKDKIGKYNSSYLFFRNGKVFGYQEDERVNATHPIRQTVANTGQAESIFDGITYQKGASTLKQLMYLVGQDKFMSSLADYFEHFSFSNATIDDLLYYIGQVFPEDVSLKQWKKTWLQTASLNILETNWDQINSKVIINQSSFDDKNILRDHKFKIAFFYQDGTFDVKQNVQIKAVQTTQINYVGSDYKAVLINHEDWSFAQVVIDQTSLQFFIKNINKIQDLFTRMMVWYNIRSMVSIGRFRVIDYYELALQKLLSQPSNFVLQRMMQDVRLSCSKYVDETTGNSFRIKLFDLVYQTLKNMPDKDQERIQIIKQQLIDAAFTDTQINVLWAWLNGDDPKLVSRVLNISEKWKIVKKIFYLQKDSLLKWKVFYLVGNEDKDASRRADNQTICAAILANQQQFAKIYESFKDPSVSLTQKQLLIQGWRSPPHYAWITKDYLDKIFRDMVTLSQTFSYDQFQFFYENLVPVDNNVADHITRYQDTIKKLKDIPNMEQHCKNIQKFVDDDLLRLNNLTKNADIDSALTRQRAVARANYFQLNSISYSYHLIFQSQTKFYNGLAQISFKLRQVPNILYLECFSEEITLITVNGITIDKKLSGQFILIPQIVLKIGANTMQVQYKNAFNNDGLGCMSFSENYLTYDYQYIYTNFQPYGAHRFVPCFDQPDLKARASFFITAPDDWMAAGNQMQSPTSRMNPRQYLKIAKVSDKILLNKFLSKAKKNSKVIAFNPTKPISTYLYCIIAGNYYVYDVPQAQLYKNIPMKHYSIQSYKDRLDKQADFITEITTLSLQLFATKFDIPYPFTKYDTAFCHQYKPGAMQNPGLITFNDVYLYPTEVSLETKLKLANTIAHQCAHNWFGDLVTMRWWDDLWLNESFADFISHYCLQQIKDKVQTISKYDSGWKLFLVRGVSGYREDQITPTTHAISSDVDNTRIAQMYFDSITYQKGSAVLKQLMFLMGEDNFMKGVHDYFVQYAWKNGTTEDFLAKMSTYFKTKDFTLDQWQQSWLLTPSVNVLTATWDPTDKSAKATITIHQSYFAPEYPLLRYHRLNIALFKDDGTYDLLQNILINPTPDFKVYYDGSPGYKAILVNADYWAYCKYTLDDVSLQFFKINLGKIDSTLTRMIIWHDMNEQVRDGKLKVTDFMAIFNAHIYDQADDKIFEFEYTFVRDALNNYISKVQRDSLKQLVFSNTLEQLVPATDTPNRIIMLKDYLPTFAVTSNHINVLEDWRSNNENNRLNKPEHLITTSQGWEVIKLLFTLTDAQLPLEVKNNRYEDQRSYDSSLKATLTYNTCQTLVADQTQFQTVYGYFKAMDYSLDVKRTYSEGWNHPVHAFLLYTKYKDLYFSDIVKLSKTLSSNHFEFFYSNLKPIDDDLTITIAEYEKLNLEGSQLIGHKKVLTQIKESYKLRSKLYQYNG